MATSAKGIDTAALMQSIASQFRGLNPNDPASWPIVPKAALCLFVSRIIVVALWFVWLTNSADEVEAEQKKEVGLREDDKKKLVQAVILAARQKQREMLQ